jgi:hypothetical protein
MLLERAGSATESPRDGPPPEPPLEQNEALIVRALIQMEQACQHDERELVRQRRDMGHAIGLKKRHGLPQRASGAQEVALGNPRVQASRVESPDLLTPDRLECFQNRQAIDQPEAQVAELIVNEAEPPLSVRVDSRPHECIEDLVTSQRLARPVRPIEDVTKNLGVVPLDDVDGYKVLTERLPTS